MIQQLRRSKFVHDTFILQISKVGVMILGLGAWIYVPVRLGPAEYGLFALAQSFLGIWQTLNLTGIKTSTATLLPAAVGKADPDEIRDLLAIYIKVSLVWAVLSLTVLMFLGSTVAARLYKEPVPLAAANALAYPTLAGWITTGNGQVGSLAALLALILLFDPFYNLILTAFRSRRAMRLMGILQNLNQLALTISLVGAALLHPTAEGQVIGRLVYSVVTLGIALGLYQRTRQQHVVPYPTVLTVLRRVPGISYRPYWRFGLENALDKNIANLYTYLPLQLVGILAGPTAASYIQLALRGINKAGFLTSAVFENMQAVVPQAIGRGDYQRLWHNFMRVQGVVALGSVVFFGFVIVMSPLLLVPIFGEEWIPVLPLLPAFALYGVVTNVGGNFGPLYRALDLTQAAVLSKIAALVVMLPAGIWLINALGALGGVWMINGLLAVPVLIIASVTLPVLWRLAREQHD